MTGVRTIRLIAARELKVRRKAFIITTALLLLLVGSGLGIMIWVTGRDTGPIRIVTAIPLPDDTAQRVADILGDGSAIDIVDAAAVTIRATVSAGEADVGVVDGSTVLGGPASDWQAVNAVANVMREEIVIAAGTAAGLSPDELAVMVAPPVWIDNTEPPPDETEVGDEVLASIGVIVMFIGLISYGQWIAYGVIEEKANRVVELILGAVRAEHLLIAKIVSIGSLGLVQLLLVGIVAGGTAMATDRLQLPESTPQALAWVIVWFLLGYALYGTVYAASGALVRTTQDAGGAVGPINMVAGLGYMVGLISMSAGEAAFTRVLSLVPLWAPLLMPARIVRGWAQPWEVALSIGIMVATTLAVIRIAAWAYRGGVARASSKLGWREAIATGRGLAHDPQTR